MSDVITESQTIEYDEKIATILRAIGNKYERLQKTGMVEVYEEDFQLSTLRSLRRLYPQLTGPGDLVFILDSGGGLLLPQDRQTFPMVPEVFANQLQKHSSGTIDFLQPDGKRIWCYFQTFTPWQWKVGYLVPDEVRNRVFQQIAQTLVVVCGSITLLVVCVLLWLIRRQLQPINQLTEISADMARGNLDRRIYVDQQDEIGDLANHFNLMQSAIIATIESVKSSEKNLHTILNSIGDAVIATDANRQIVRFNPIAEHLTGWSKEEAIGQLLEDVLVVVDPETRQSLKNDDYRIGIKPPQY